MPNFRPSGYDQWASAGFQSVLDMQDAQSADMDGQFVTGNLIAVMTFINEYLPAKANRPPVLPFVFSEAAIKDEKTWAEEASKICANLTFLDTHNGSSQSEGESRRPDISGICLPRAGEKPAFDIVDPQVILQLLESKYRDIFRHASLIVERKLASQDAFRDTVTGIQEKPTKTSGRVRGQLICYNLHQFREQPRIFSFQLLLIDKYARLIRWDRSGAVVTEAFDWTTGTLLSEFLTRFAAASSKERGIDTTVHPASPEEQRQAEQACEREGLPKPRAPFWVYEVTDEPDAVVENSGPTPADPTLDSPSSAPQSDPAPVSEAECVPEPASRSRGETREFVVGRPVSNPRAFTGRTSTGFVAYDVKANDVAYLKDAWCPNDPDIVPEGQIYRKLQPAEGEQGCPFIPTLVCAGDVYDSDGQRQETVSDEQVPPHLKANSRIRRYTHTRTVVREVGVPMTAFNKVSDLLQLMCDTIDAHEYATQRKVLHRDISAGNIMINRKGDTARALLVDWDLALDMTKVPTSEQQYITGTWQFMSIALLRNKEYHRHDAYDDLESVFWLLCYCLVRYSNLYPGSDASAREFLHSVFDVSRNPIVQDPTQSTQRIGGEEKNGLLCRLEKGNSSDMQPPTLTTVLSELFREVSTSLLYHVELREWEHLLAAAMRQTTRTVDEDKQLALVQRRLKGHRGGAPEHGQLFGYASLRAACAEATTAMRNCETSFTSSNRSSPAPPSPGTLRVGDRYEEKKGRKDAPGRVDTGMGNSDSGEAQAQTGDMTTEGVDEGASGEDDERVEKRTARGSVKRGSSHENEPEPKAARSVTPTRARSSRSATGSYRAELASIVDNSPLKPVKSAAEGN